AAGYSAYLLCYNQLFLALPTELRRWSAETHTLGWLFALSSTLVVCGQLPLTTLARRRLGRSRGLAMGFSLMATGFAVVAFAVRGQDRSIVLVSCAIMVILLTLGQMLAVPLAQDLVSLLAKERRLGAYFGFLGSVAGFVVL